jgi:hypothetical protein
MHIPVSTKNYPLGYRKRYEILARHWWLTPITTATWEAETGRMTV